MDAKEARIAEAAHCPKAFAALMDENRGLIKQVTQYLYREWDEAKNSFEEDEDWGDKEEAAKPKKYREPPGPIKKAIITHFKQRPFDRLRWGVLKIETKNDGLQPFVMNKEQRIGLDRVERRYYAKKAVRNICLKARQIGWSTFCKGCDYCLLAVGEHITLNTICDLTEKAEHQREMILTFWENEPEWIRPKLIQRKNPFKFHEPDKGVRKVRVRIETAERGEGIGRAFTTHVGHFSELPYWKKGYQEQILNSLLKTVPDGYPSVVNEESSGRLVGDFFYNRFFAAYRTDGTPGGLGEYEAFFFAWFDHEEYKKPFASQQEREIYVEEMLESDKERMETYKLSLEQMHWYTTKRDEEVLGKGITYDLFCREYPSNPHEAFLGGSTNYFEPEKVKALLARTAPKKDSRISLCDLPKSASSIALEQSGVPIKFAKAALHSDYENMCAAPKLICRNELPADSAIECPWTIWELPRPHHKYVVSSDPATNVQRDPKLISSKDNSTIGVWRYSYEEGDLPCIVQVAQYMKKFADVEQVAREAVAMSVLYSEFSGTRSLLVPEANAHGILFIDVAKKLRANLYTRQIFDRHQNLIGEELGFLSTTGKTADGAKSVLYGTFRQAWMGGHYLILSAETASEMAVFVDDNGKLRAQGVTNHDDTVTEVALGCMGIRRLIGTVKAVKVEWKAPTFVEQQVAYSNLPKLKQPERMFTKKDDRHTWIGGQRHGNKWGV